MAEGAIRQERAEMPDYGVDAPGVVKAFFAGAVSLAVTGSLVLTLADPPLSLFALPFFLGAIILSGLGTSMLVYAFAGKQRLRDHLLRQWSWRGDEVVLDIGAGRGLMAVGAAHRTPMGKAIALDVWSAKDLSGNTPDGLLHNAIIERVERNVEVITSDARTLNMGDATVDVVVSVFCIHNIEPEIDRQRACKEIARVLKPGGMAMIADFPGVGPYVTPFRQAGLSVVGPLRGERIAFSICGYLVASKPASLS